MDQLDRSLRRVLHMLPELLFDRTDPLHLAARVEMENQMMAGMNDVRPTMNVRLLFFLLQGFWMN
jgi:hypothetical protein